MNNVSLTLSDHFVAPGKKVIEVRGDGGKLLATITQGDKPNTIRLITRHTFVVENTPSVSKILEITIELQ